jgi:hypothetical protein
LFAATMRMQVYELALEGHLAVPAYEVARSASGGMTVSPPAGVRWSPLQRAAVTGDVVRRFELRLGENPLAGVYGPDLPHRAQERILMLLKASRPPSVTELAALQALVRPRSVVPVGPAEDGQGQGDGGGGADGVEPGDRDPDGHGRDDAPEQVC